MKDENKTKNDLINELVELRPRIAELETVTSDPKRRRAAKVLRERNEQLASTIEAFDGLIFISSPDYRIQFMNKRLIERTGYEATGEFCYKAIHDLDSICPWCVNDRVLKGETVRWEVQSPKDDCWYDVVNTLKYNTDGSISQLAMLTDVTEHKLAVEKVQKQHDHLEKLLEKRTSELRTTNQQLQQEINERKHLVEALQVKSHNLGERVKELNYLYGVSKLMEWPNISFEEILQGAVDLILPAFQHPEITCARITLEAHEFRSENFRQTDWKLAGVIIVNGERAGSLEVCYLEERQESDEGPFLKEERGLINAILEQLGRIIERKRAEEELRFSEERYRLLTENVVEAVAVVQDGKFAFANDNFVTLFGYTRAGDVVGKDLGVVCCPDLQKHFAMELEELEPRAFRENVFVAPCRGTDGREFWVEVRHNNIKWEGNPAVLATLRDVTESRLKQIAIEEEKARLLKENINLRATMKDRFRFGDIVGKSPAMQEVYELILKAGRSDHSIVIYGESGTGKELVARTIYQMSDRYNKAFVPVNCGAIQETLFEREFFGNRKGAYTGAYIDNQGFFDLAHGGILFLDEIGEFNPNMQVKLIRAIEGRGYTPVGDSNVKKADVRIIAATNRDLADRVRKGLMREDFFYRIHIITINLPLLRNRREDIPLLIDHFLQSHPDGITTTAIPGKIMEALCNYHWPGNVRELQNVLLRYLVTNRLDFISPTLPDESGDQPAIEFNTETINLRAAVENFEKTLVSKALAQTHWNKTKAARLLGISRRALFRKMKDFEVQ